MVVLWVNKDVSRHCDISARDTRPALVTLTLIQFKKKKERKESQGVIANIQHATVDFFFFFFKNNLKNIYI